MEYEMKDTEKGGVPPPYASDDYGDDEKMKKKKEDDAWEVVSLGGTDDWDTKSCGQKTLSVLLVFVKLILLVGFLYLFVCSLGFLSDAFKLLGGKAAGEAFSQNEILNNPVTCLMLGVLATVLLQSSSTTTSIVVTMVAEQFIETQPAIFVIMGANIGTTVTNTIVSLGQAMDRNEFRRAFGGATVHDMFNWLAVVILLPVDAIVAAIPGTEIPKDDLLATKTPSNGTKACGMLCHLTRAIVNPISESAKQDKALKKDLLKVITKPFTSLVVQINKNAITDAAKAEAKATILKGCNETGAPDCHGKQYLFAIIRENVGWNDAGLGALLLICSLFLLCVCLVCIVKLLHSMLRGHIARLLKKFINADLPGCAKYFTGYLAILFGAGMTMLVQSSSIFTSAVTPLVGIGVLRLERMYPLTLGSNIGTTLTALLASLAQSASKIPLALQVALCHLFFNIFGIIIWYPIPFMRKVPISLAKKLGNTTAKYRWFAVLYLVLMFFVMPGAAFGLSVAGWQVLAGVGGAILLIFVIIVVINILQVKKPEAICCSKLRTWDFLPKPLHSLAPYDKVCRACMCCRRCKGDPIE